MRVETERTKEIARAKRREAKLPADARAGRSAGTCCAKHPKAEFWCWLSAGHDGDYHTAGLEDWPRKGKR